MDLMIFPYGNAKETKKPDGSWSFKCQHGGSECFGNLIEACAIHTYNDTSKWFPYINCIEGSKVKIIEKAAPECAKQLNLNYTALDACATSAEGNAIMHGIATTTDNLQPPHQWTPWVVLDGKPLSSKQLSQPLVTLVCDAYTGTKPAACSNYKKGIEICLK